MEFNTTPNEELFEEIREHNSEVMTMDGYDHCIIGLVDRFGIPPVVLYDYEKVIDTLMEDMTREEAEEWFSYNMIGAWVGDSTPAFFYRLKSIDYSPSLREEDMPRGPEITD